MKVTCDKCECGMKITSSFRYFCQECKNEIEIAFVQDTNSKYHEKHKKSIEWVKIRGNEIIVQE